MFFEPQQTQFDLNFRLLGVHIRVHPWFWLVSAFLGWDWMKSGRDGFLLLLLWIACVFVSVLVHEFGHIFMGRLFGSNGHVVLYGMGGLAIGSSEVRNRWGRIAVYFAGPAAGLLLWLVVYLGSPYILHKGSPRLLIALTLFLTWINLFWSLLNLIPVWPLDGGRMSREFLEWLLPERGTGAALGISFVIAALLAINSISIELKHPLPLFDQIPYLNGLLGWYTAILFGMFALISFQMLQAESQRYKRWDRDDY